MPMKFPERSFAVTRDLERNPRHSYRTLSLTMISLELHLLPQRDSAYFSLAVKMGTLLNG